MWRDKRNQESDVRHQIKLEHALHKQASFPHKREFITAFAKSKYFHSYEKNLDSRLRGNDARFFCL